MKDEDCLTGACPPLEKIDVNNVKLSEGSGGKEMGQLISTIRKNLRSPKDWKNSDEDSATLKFKDTNLVFTTDSYVVTPIFFPGGNIGKLAFCGTVNDLVVMGAKPLGISLGLVLEEGLSKKDLAIIMQTIGELSNKHNIPIVTGDTKVMDKNTVDKIIINTSGIGYADTVLDTPLTDGDKIIVSGGIGEHGSALLAKRFELETDLATDSKALLDEMQEIRHLIKQAKDITRGGLASVLNETSIKQKKQLQITEEDIPVLVEVQSLTELLGIEPYSLACEGRLVCFCKRDFADEVVKRLKKFNPMAAVIGEVASGSNVIMQTRFGKKLLSMPSGNIVPRIC